MAYKCIGIKNCECSELALSGRLMCSNCIIEIDKVKVTGISDNDY